MLSSSSCFFYLKTVQFIKEYELLTVDFSENWKISLHKEILIVFSYFSLVEGVTFVQKYMLTLGLLSWQQAYHFYLYSPVQPLISFSVYWRLWYKSNFALLLSIRKWWSCHADISYLKVIKYVFIFLFGERNMSGRNIYGILTPLLSF